MSIESAPSSISTISPEVSSPSFSPVISNEANFNFNPSRGGMVDLKIETYTRPIETGSSPLKLPQNFSYPEFDLDIQGRRLEPTSETENLLELPKFELPVERQIEEIKLPSGLAETIQSESTPSSEEEKTLDTVQIKNFVEQIKTDNALSPDEQAIWVPKFEKLLEEKINEAMEEPASFAEVIKIEEAEPKTITQREPETSILPQPNTETFTDQPGIITTNQPQAETLAANTEEVKETQLYELDSDSNDLPPIDPEDPRTGLEDEPNEEIEEKESIWEVWKLSEATQVAKESLERRLDLASNIVKESSQNETAELKNIVEGQIYKLDIPSAQDFIENVDLPPVAHFAEIELSKVSQEASIKTVHKAVTDAIKSKLPTKTVKHSTFEGLQAESKLPESAKEIAKKGAKHIYHSNSKGYQAQDSATRTHPWEADKEGA